MTMRNFSTSRQNTEREVERHARDIVFCFTEAFVFLLSVPSSLTIFNSPGCVVQPRNEDALDTAPRGKPLYGRSSLGRLMCSQPCFLALVSANGFLRRGAVEDSGRYLDASCVDGGQGRPFGSLLVCFVDGARVFVLPCVERRACLWCPFVLFLSEVVCRDHVRFLLFRRRDVLRMAGHRSRSFLSFVERAGTCLLVALGDFGRNGRQTVSLCTATLREPRCGVCGSARALRVAAHQCGHLSALAPNALRRRIIAQRQE